MLRKRLGWAGYFLVLLSLIIIEGCAWFDEENRRTLTKLDELIAPQSIASKISLAPPTTIVGGVALLTDIVIVNPAVAIPATWDDMHDLFWKDGFGFNENVTYFPIRAILTPPTFLFDWVFRSFFIGVD